MQRKGDTYVLFSASKRSEVIDQGKREQAKKCAGVVIKPLFVMNLSYSHTVVKSGRDINTILEQLMIAES